MAPRRKIEFPAEVHPEYLAELRRRIETGPGVGPVAKAAEMSRSTLWRTLNGGDQYQTRVTVDAVERARHSLASFGQSEPMPPPLVPVRGTTHHAWIEIGNALLSQDPELLARAVARPAALVEAMRSWVAESER